MAGLNLFAKKICDKHSSRIATWDQHGAKLRIRNIHIISEGHTVSVFPMTVPAAFSQQALGKVPVVVHGVGDYAAWPVLAGGQLVRLEQAMV